ncbi:MAG: hypothetical protein JXR37_35110 [Kiritimatiellae bacterium]|nr:hypothetical protein [Kiritimatiellia bacterium]
MNESSATGEMPAKRARPRAARLPFVKRVLFGLIVTVLLAAVLEAGGKLMRAAVGWKLATGAVVPDALLHHKWVPGKRTFDASRGAPYPLIINRQSWVETYDVRREKPGGTWRVFYLGDSTTQGVVAPEYKMVEIVERELNRRYAGRGARFELINTGTSSYACLQYFLLVRERLMPYAPDLVMINVDMTDVVNDAVYRRLARKDGHGAVIGIGTEVYERYVMGPRGYYRAPSFLRMPECLTRHSDFFAVFDALARRAVANQSARRAEWDQTADWLAMEWTPVIEESVKASMDTLRQTIRLLKARGVRVAISGVPNHGQYTGTCSPRPHAALAQVAAAESVPCLNAYEALRPRIAGTTVEEFYWRDDPTHFNIEGNRAWADVQIAFLLDPANDLLPLEREEDSR